MRYSYFQESDTVSSLIAENATTNAKIESLKVQLTKKQTEQNYLVNGGDARNGQLLGINTGGLKFTDLQTQFNNMTYPAPDANGNYTPAQQQQNAANNALEQMYLFAKERIQNLPAEITAIQNEIASLTQKTKDIDALINKKAAQNTVASKKSPYMPILIAITIITGLYFLTKK